VPSRFLPTHRRQVCALTQGPTCYGGGTPLTAVIFIIIDDDSYATSNEAQRVVDVTGIKRFPCSSFAPRRPCVRQLIS